MSPDVLAICIEFSDSSLADSDSHTTLRHVGEVELVLQDLLATPVDKVLKVFSVVELRECDLKEATNPVTVDEELGSTVL